MTELAGVEAHLLDVGALASVRARARARERESDGEREADRGRPTDIETARERVPDRQTKT